MRVLLQLIIAITKLMAHQFWLWNGRWDGLVLFSLVLFSLHTFKHTRPNTEGGKIRNGDRQQTKKNENSILWIWSWTEYGDLVFFMSMVLSSASKDTHIHSLLCACGIGKSLWTRCTWEKLLGTCLKLGYNYHRILSTWNLVSGIGQITSFLPHVISCY